MGLNKSRQWKKLLGGEVAIRFSFQIESFTHIICSSNWITNCSIWSKHTFLKETSHQKGNNMYFSCRTWSLNRLLHFCWATLWVSWLGLRLWVVRSIKGTNPVKSKYPLIISITKYIEWCLILTSMILLKQLIFPNPTYKTYTLLFYLDRLNRIKAHQMSREFYLLNNV